jgi:spore maturation protein CgeB
MKLVIIGLSITSSWGNGHATTYRGLVREFARRGHHVTFLERDVPWYAENRDLAHHPDAATCLYADVGQLQEEYVECVGEADAVIVGSYVPDGIEVSDWVQQTASGVVAFYDIDTPVTLAKLVKGECEYVALRQIPYFDVYFSFTGGKTLRRIERDFGAPRARALYCSVDPEMYYREENHARWDLGYLGTYSDDRQTALDRLLVEPARAWPAGRFVVAGPQYPSDIVWPPNVERHEHLAPREHRRFYNSQRFTLNITRADMIAAGHSPSVRLFEAAACATPIISDWWEGLDEIFEPGRDILVACDANEVLRLVRDLPASTASAIGKAGREKVLAGHTAAHRAAGLEQHLLEAMQQPASAVV